MNGSGDVTGVAAAASKKTTLILKYYYFFLPRPVACWPRGLLEAGLGTRQPRSGLGAGLHPLQLSSPTLDGSLSPIRWLNSAPTPPPPPPPLSPAPQQ
ncbi:hypothetical protein E2C01_057832 [Portunus trituberculatus]|uniref:Uncharacterized protein n=1 Tax=Portunus trituberculatus TaxID=210409 RepID=A0A5B7GUK7_PORTR|nr:hypothetical protein [Portunus trituberculatus]